MTIQTLPPRALIRVADLVATWLVRLVGLCALGVLVGVSFDRFIQRFSASEGWRTINGIVCLLGFIAFGFGFELYVFTPTRWVRPIAWQWVLSFALGLVYFAFFLGLFVLGFRVAWWRDGLE